MERKPSLRRRRGGMLVTVALSALALLGVASLCADVGILSVHKQADVNACDAGALAGCAELPDKQAAEVAARDVARRNGLQDPIRVLVEDDAVGVVGGKPVSLAFSQLFGIESRPVSGRGWAVVKEVNVIRGGSPLGMRPWAIDDNLPVQYGSVVTLKFGLNDLDDTLGYVVGGGHFGCVAIEGRGSSVYKDKIVYGADGVYTVGQELDVEPGNKVGPTNQGVHDLLRTANVEPWSSQTWNTAEVGNPRLIVIPIVDWDVLGNGRSTVPIKGFACFYLIDASQGSVTGVFLARNYTASNADWDPNAPPPLSTYLRKIKLEKWPQGKDPNSGSTG